jgi:hypothetical protein
MRRRVLAAVAVSVLAGAAREARAEDPGRGGFVEIVAGEAIPLAAERHRTRTRISPRLGVRGGFLWAFRQPRVEYPWVLGFELGFDYTAIAYDQNVLPTADSSRYRFTGGVRAGVWRSARRMLFLRAAIGLDHVGMELSGPSAPCATASSSAFAAEAGSGLLLLVGRLAFGAQADLAFSFHRSDTECAPLAYTSMDLDLLLTVAATF